MKSILLFVIFLFICSCSSAPEKKEPVPEKTAQTSINSHRTGAKHLLLESSSAKRPPWTSAPIKKGAKWIFVGKSSKSNDPDTAKKKALNNAFGEISKYIGVSVKSQLKSYQENLGGSNAEVVFDTTKTTGSEIKISNFSEDYYTEKWNRNGNIGYDAWVKVAVPSTTMKKLELERENRTAWLIKPDNSCNITDELNTFIVETGTRKGWKMTASETNFSSPFTIDSFFKNPETAFLAVLDTQCTTEGMNDSFKVTAKISLAHYALTKNSVSNVYSAQGTIAAGDKETALNQAVKLAQNNLSEQLFTYAGSIISDSLPPMPTQTSLSDLDVLTLELFERAQKKEAYGRLLPRQVAEQWKILLEKEGDNPYKETAQKRMEFWNSYAKQLQKIDASHQEEKEKLKKVLSMDVVPLQEKVRFTREYLYNFSVIYGAEELLDIINSIKEAKKRRSFIREVFSKNILEQWNAACDRNDGAACYFLSITTPQNIRNTLLEKACRANHGRACHELAKSYNRKGKRKESLEYAEKACKKGISNSCFIAGKTYYTGAPGVPINLNSAINFFDKTCHSKEKSGCAYMGWIYEHGEQVTQDIQIARQYYKKACEYGHIKSCQKIAQ